MMAKRENLVGGLPDPFPIHRPSALLLRVFCSFFDKKPKEIRMPVSEKEKYSEKRKENLKAFFEMHQIGQTLTKNPTFIGCFCQRAMAFLRSATDFWASESGIPVSFPLSESFLFFLTNAFYLFINNQINQKRIFNLTISLINFSSGA